MDLSSFEFIRPLLESQPWIESVDFVETLPKKCICLNDFRRTWFSNRRRSSNLFQAYAEQFNTNPLPEDVAWLSVQPVVIPDRPVVISRSSRYRNPRFPWAEVALKYRHRIAFVGLESEFFEWRLHFGNWAIFYPVSDALDLARVIAGSKLFIGNQSFPMSLALATNTRLIQEVGHPNADCRFHRQTALYYESGKIMLPDIV